MGGQNVSCDFGGGKRTIECALQNQFWRPQKVGFAWSVPVSSKENNRAKTNGGGKRIIGGGVQNRFWEGVLWYVFPSPESSTPLCFSLKNAVLPCDPLGVRPKNRCEFGALRTNVQARMKFHASHAASPPFPKESFKAIFEK